MAVGTSALFLSILISTAACATYRDGIPQYRTSVMSECLQINGFISINDIQVPSSGLITHAWCNDGVVEVTWERGKKTLVFFFTEDGSTFQLDTLEYTEDGTTWCTEEPQNQFKGIVGGKVVCSQSVTYSMDLCRSKQLKSYRGKILDDPAKQLVPPTEEIESTHNPSGENVLNTEENSTFLPESTFEPIETGISAESNTGGSAIIIEDGMGATESSFAPEEIRITLFDLFISFNPSQTRDYVTYCRVEPDLTVTWAVSGSLAAAAVLAMVAIAMRVLW